MADILAPLIRQRADPFIRRHGDGFYYFTASVPEYDRVEVRRAPTIAALATAEPVAVWRKPATGPLCELIWAPEIHWFDGAWHIYFAAAPSREIKDDLFQHRIYVISTSGENPLTAKWEPPRRMETGMDTFCLDATTFAHRGARYFVWAQKDRAIAGNSNLYIARMHNAHRLALPAARLSVPELAWETRGFSVNEGPAVVIRHGRVFLSYSASATDENYCLGLLHASEEADLLDPASWTKSVAPVFETDYEREVFGPGHNSFTVAEDGATDLLVYHARTYREIVGDPLWNPDRHTFVKPLRWDAQGMPVFGRPSVSE
jgi:GH43 family beta-xylosidase